MVAGLHMDMVEVTQCHTFHHKAYTLYTILYISALCVQSVLCVHSLVLSVQPFLLVTSRSIENTTE